MLWKMVVELISRNENIFSYYIIKMSARLISGSRGAACSHPAKEQRALFRNEKRSVAVSRSLAHFYAMCVWFTTRLIIKLYFTYKAAHPLMLIRSAVKAGGKYF